MRQCKHPTCGDTCRRPKPDAKPRQQIKRTPLQKKPYKIKATSKKRAGQLQEYKTLKEEFLAVNDECQIKVPGICTYSALVIHHTNGRENERLLIVEDWLASCPECNIWIETSAGTKWAYDNEKKKYKHRLQKPQVVQLKFDF
jgi:hypothetical protein